MEQKIIIRKSDYVTETEEKYEEDLEFNYMHTRFSEFEKHSEFLNINVDGHRGLSLYLELDRWQAKTLIKELEEKLKLM